MPVPSARSISRPRPARLDTLADEEARDGLIVVRTTSIDEDAQVEYERITDDPNDDYLAHAALLTGAYLVTRDEAAHFERVQDLRVGRPGTALRLVGAFNHDDAGPQT